MFFFKQKTAYEMRISDWSSDVCSSDLLAKAMMSINAVKAVEIGAGLEAAALSGEDNADEMRLEGNRVAFTSNRAGGILGGISTGQDVVVRFAGKPTSSILTPRRTVSAEERRGGKECVSTFRYRWSPSH